MTEEFQDRFVTVNGLALHYVDWDAGSETSGRRPMVLVHGVTDNCRLWDGFARTFRRQYRVLAIDQRGHGDSEWSAEKAYKSTDLASDLSAFFAELGLQDSNTRPGISFGIGRSSRSDLQGGQSARASPPPRSRSRSMRRSDQRPLERGGDLPMPKRARHG